jgi:integrase/recombinase XerD
MQAIKEQFKEYIKQLGYSKSSINMLPTCVAAFLKYHNIQDPKQVNSKHIQTYYEYLKQRKHQRKATTLSESFIHHNIYALQVFFNWLERAGQIQENPISNITFKRPIPNKREPLTQEEVKKLFAATETNKEIAILHIFYSCGLRRTEAENLNLKDIDFTANLLYVRSGKGSKRRVIPITQKVKTELQQYVTTDRNTQISAIEITQVTIMKTKKLTTEKQTEAFMINARGKRMQGQYYNKALKQLLQRTTMDKNKDISLHHLRHSIATHLLENGLGVEYVRDFLGHIRLETTQVYTKVYKHQIQNLQ